MLISFILVPFWDSHKHFLRQNRTSDEIPLEQLWHQPVAPGFDTSSSYHNPNPVVNSFVAVAYVPSSHGGNGDGVAILRLRLHGVYLLLPSL